MTLELPTGDVRTRLVRDSLLVGAGVAITGLASYVFLVVAARALGPAEYGALAVLWSMVYIASGVFIPLEQEVSRALAARRTRGIGGAPLLRRAAMVGAGAVLVVGVVVVLTSSIAGDAMLRGDHLLVAALVTALAGLAVARLFGGALSGTGRFGRYGLYLSLDAIVRLTMCLAFAGLGLASSWPYAMALALSPLLAIVPARVRLGAIAGPGPQAPWRELSVALGALLLSSLMAATLLYAPAVLIEALIDEVAKRDAGVFNAALVLTRVPVVLFSAVLIALLPRLSTLVAEGRASRIPRALGRPLAAIAVLLILGTIASFALGPAVVNIVYGSEYETTADVIGVLTAGTSLYVVALTLSQGLIAMEAVSRAAWSWAMGLAGLLAVVAAADLGAPERVALGYLAGSMVAAVAMGGLLVATAGGASGGARPRASMRKGGQT